MLLAGTARESMDGAAEAPQHVFSNLTIDRMVFSEQISDSIVHVGFFVFGGVTRWHPRRLE